MPLIFGPYFLITHFLACACLGLVLDLHLAFGFVTAAEGHRKGEHETSGMGTLCGVTA